MDFLRIGSANQYAKRLARETQWNLKKQSGDFTGHKKSLEDYVNVTKASSVLPQTDEADKKLSGIMTKAQEGRKLSPDEWEYLRVKHPEMYEKFREMEREQENYEKALRRCKTRDEAQRLHVSKLGEVMTAAKNGDESALCRLNRLTRTMTAFTESKEYRELPTEAEEAIARESERQAERDALREEAITRENARQAEQEALREEAERTEAERDAENLSGDDAEIKSETVSGDETGIKFDTVSEDETGIKSDIVSKDETETESGTRFNDGAKTKVETVPESKIGRNAGKVSPSNGVGTVSPSNVGGKVSPSNVGAVSRSTHATRNAETSRAATPQSNPTDAGQSANRGGASVLSFGQRAYLNQRDRKSRQKSFEAEA